MPRQRGAHTYSFIHAITHAHTKYFHTHTRARAHAYTHTVRTSMSKQLHWKNWLLPLYCRLYILRKNHIQCKVKKAHTPTLSANKCKKKKEENKKKTLKIKRIGIQINMTNETKNIYIIMSSIEAFFGLKEHYLEANIHPFTL